MRNYDFSSLSDKDFEILVCDLLARELNQRFERFRPGRDGGVDGRYFTSKGEAVLQCKHWLRSSVGALTRAMKAIELPKIRALRPTRYFLATSLPLTRANKRKLAHLLQPFVASDSDILGAEDINDLLDRHPSVERSNFKLWLSSTSLLTTLLNNAVLGRSDFSLQEIISRSPKYVRTTAHARGAEKLNEHGVVIITGEPGVGKSMLAEQLCLEYIRLGYDLVVFSDSVEEIEGVFDRDDQKQMFYFDDFLGRNYLLALDRHEDTAIVNFIRRVAKSKNKRFVLTSRTNVLQEGKRLSDQFEIHNINRNEFEVRVQNMTDADRAHILYNHLWYSDLQIEFLQEIVANRRYREIIGHQNFNPRLISFVTDRSRLESLEPKSYWPYIQDKLENPADIWEHTFASQLDDYGRAIVSLVVFSDGVIEEDGLNDAYTRLLSDKVATRWTGRSEFYSGLRMLCGSLLNRAVAVGGNVWISLFNPSVADFVIHRYRRDGPYLSAVYSALLSGRSIRAFESLVSSGLLKSEVAKAAYSGMLGKLEEVQPTVEMAERLIILGADMATEHDLEAVRSLIELMVAEEAEPSRWERFAPAISKYVATGRIGVAAFAELLERVSWDYLDFDDLTSLAELGHRVIDSTTDDLRDHIRDAVVALWLNDGRTKLEELNVINHITEDDQLDDAERLARDAIQEELDHFTSRGIDFSWSEVDDIVRACEIRSIVRENRKAGKDSRMRDQISADTEPEDDGIDDLFVVDLPARF